MSYNNQKIVESKIKCPKCKSDHLFLVEIWTDHGITWEQIGGKFDRNDGILDPGSPAWVEGECKKCGHRWKVKNAPQIDYVIKD